MTNLMILLGTIQKETDTNVYLESVFRIQWNIYDGTFLQK